MTATDEPTTFYDMPEDVDGMEEMAWRWRRLVADALTDAELPLRGSVDKSGEAVIDFIQGTHANGTWIGSRGRRRDFGLNLANRRFTSFDSTGDPDERAHDAALNAIDVTIRSALHGRDLAIDTIATDLLSAVHWEKNGASLLLSRARMSPTDPLQQIITNAETARDRAATALLRLAIAEHGDPAGVEAMNVMVGLGFRGRASDLLRMGSGHTENSS